MKCSALSAVCTAHVEYSAAQAGGGQRRSGLCSELQRLSSSGRIKEAGSSYSDPPLTPRRKVSIVREGESHVWGREDSRASVSAARTTTRWQLQQQTRRSNRGASGKKRFPLGRSAHATPRSASSPTSVEKYRVHKPLDVLQVGRAESSPAVIVKNSKLYLFKH